MKHSLTVGFSFGLTSGIITTLGLMTGLYAETHSRTVVIGGILTIAIADAFSDALGIHISEESEQVHTGKEIWLSTFSVFLTKFFTAMSFLPPVIFLSPAAAVWISITWGLLLLSIVSYRIAQKEKGNPWSAVAEHLGIAVIVILFTQWAGSGIREYFGTP